MANATYRAFNFPHHVTTYLSLYYAARNTQLKTYTEGREWKGFGEQSTISFGKGETYKIKKVWGHHHAHRRLTHTNKPTF